jgi:hypothetical protein
VRTGLLAILVVLAARPALAERMTFAWPVPAKVTVTDKVNQPDSSATLRYQVTLTRHGDGKELAVHLGNFEFLEVGGHDARDPALRKQLHGALEVASALPTILVSPEGGFLDVVDIEAMIDRIVRSSTIPAKERAALARTMKSPMMLSSMKARSVEFWNVWVGLWAGADLEPGRTRQIKVRTSLPNGSLVERPVMVSHQGPAGPPGYVHLSFDSTIEGGSQQAALRTALQDSFRQLGGPGAKDSDQEIESLSLSIGGEVITDPNTLKPAAARSTRSTTVKLKGQPPRREQESHEYTFSWSEKDGPPAAARRAHGK